MDQEKNLNRSRVSSVRPPKKYTPGKQRPKGLLRQLWSELTRHPLGLVGLVIILVFVVMAVSHPILMERVWPRGVYDPVVGFDYDVESHPSFPSARHLLGTDSQGRDVLSQLMYATRTSFGVGLVAGLTATLIATLIGVAAAYLGGWVDTVLMVVAGAFVLMPPAIMMIIVGLLVDFSWPTMGLIFGVFAGLGAMAITFKAHAQAIRVKPYVDASQIAGGGDLHIIRVHVLPGMLSVMLVTMVFTVSQAVLIEALLSFYGRSQARLSWGTMIWYLQTTFRASASGEQWHAILPPALAITLFCGAFYMLGRAMDEIINPRLRER